jgi:hypothetical protein
MSEAFSNSALFIGSDQLRSNSVDASLTGTLPSLIVRLASLPADSSVAGTTSPIQQTLAGTASAPIVTDGSHCSATRAYKSVHKAKLHLNAHLSAGLPGYTFGVRKHEQLAPVSNVSVKLGAF